MIKNNQFRFNLQFFAADGNEGGASNNVDEPSSNEQPTEDKPFKVFQTEKELNSWFDSNFDKRYEKALTKAKAKWEQEQNQQKAYDDMSDSEKKEFDYNQKQKELDKRLADVTIRENRANVANRLASDGLQASLVDVFKLDDTDSLEEQYENVTKVFKKAVDDQVQIKLTKQVDHYRKLIDAKDKEIYDLRKELTRYMAGAIQEPPLNAKNKKEDKDEREDVD